MCMWVGVLYYVNVYVLCVCECVFILLHVYYYVCCMYASMYAHHSTHVRSEDNVQDLLLFFPHVRPGWQMVAIKPGIIWLVPYLSILIFMSLCFAYRYQIPSSVGFYLFDLL